MFELYQLHCFLALAEELHFGRAAARLGRTQPPFSRQIQLLEDSLGVRLVDRNNRATGLTYAGRMFLPEARRVVQLAAAAADLARLASRGEAGMLSVGSTPIASFALIPRLLGAFKQSHPAVTVSVREMLTGGQINALISRQLSVGLARPPLVRPGLQSITIHEEGLVLAVPADDPLCEAPELDLGCLDGRTYLMHSADESPYFYDLVTSLLRDAGVKPDIVQHTGFAHSIVAMVSAGMGMALVPQSVTRMMFENVRYLPMRLPANAVARFVLAWRADNDDPVLHAFVDQVRRIAAPAAGGPSHSGDTGA